MSAVLKIVSAVLVVLLTLTLYGWWYTNQPVRAAQRAPSGFGRALSPIDSSTGIDETGFALTQRLKALAEGPDELRLADTAERLADHELDLAFTAALRQIEAHPPALSPAAQAIQDRLQKSQKQLESDQASVSQLTAALAQAPGPEKAGLQDQLDLAASQLELDKDEVQEADHDLLEAGGNQHQRIQSVMQQHSATDRVRPLAAATANPTSGPKGLVRALQQWQALRRKQEWLLYAASQADANRTRLSTDRNSLAERLETSKAGVPELAHHTKSARADSPPDPVRPVKPVVPAAATASNTPNLLRTARVIGADQKQLTLLDSRMADLKLLSGVYLEWNTNTASQAMATLHGMLVSVAVVLAILLLLLFVDRCLERLLARTRLDRRQMETLRSVTRVALQLLGIVIILLIAVGVPGQIGTMIGLAGAGLTVALKDFIVAFIGWLVLMGRNGVRLGDWVEINGVSGEVVELGMFHTVLLETGNWTDAGHPTGRRVTFTNSFAIERHYFNFSTSGQWLWDELLILVPYDKDPNLIAEAIHQQVLVATAESAGQAEQEWHRTAATRRSSVFSAAPGISVRPAVGGVEVAVRYITRASERFRLRSKLFQSAVNLLGVTGPHAPSAATPPA